MGWRIRKRSLLAEFEPGSFIPTISSRCKFYLPRYPKTYWFQLVIDNTGKTVTECVGDFWSAASNALQTQEFWADDNGLEWDDDQAIDCFKEMECALVKAQGEFPVPGGCANRPVVDDPWLKNTVTNAVCF